MTVEQYEKAKYRELWKDGKYRSPNAESYAEEISGSVWGHVLDIGCGDCATMDVLNRNPIIVCSGIDITIEQCPPGRQVCEGTVWAMTFKDKQFDFSLSTDVLEHIPTELIPQTLAEISRVTKWKTFHYISTWPAVTAYEGQQVHLTVAKPEWWEAIFAEHCRVPYVLKFW